MRTIIGIDYSLRSPAVSVLTKDNQIHHFLFPRIGVHKKLFIENLKLADVIVTEIPDIKVPKDLILREQLNSQDAENLALIVCQTINPYCQGELQFAIEGMSFNAPGNSKLQVSAYVSILRYLISKHFTVPYDTMFTYSPMTIKSINLCSKRGIGKAGVIEAFISSENSLNQVSKFWQTLRQNPEMFQNKNGNWLKIDDIIDSFHTIICHLEKSKELS